MNENDKQVDIEIPDEENLLELDETTDWKLKADELQKKHREAGIRNRERTKALKDKVTELEKLSSKPPIKEAKSNSDEFGLLQKTYLRSAGVIEEDEIELAKNIQSKTGLDWDKLVDDDYFKTKLEGLRTSKTNVIATSNIRGGKGSETKNTPEYWIAKGEIPSREQIPDRTTRVKIARTMMANARTSGKKFYND